MTRRSDRAAFNLLAGNLLLALVYFAAAKLALNTAFVHASTASVWPPTGIAIAVILLAGNRFLPGIFVGAFLANFLTAGSLTTSFAIGIGNSLEALVAAMVAKKYAGGAKAFERPIDVFSFTILTCLLSTTVSPTIGLTALCLEGFADWHKFPVLWSTWWLGDAGGALLVTPLIILWSQNRSWNWDVARTIELIIAVAFLITLGEIVFGSLVFQRGDRYSMSVLTIPLIVGIAFRFGNRETALSVFILCCIAIRGTLSGFGPFSHGNPNEALLSLQVFMGVLSMTGMAVAATVRQRNQVQAALEQKAELLARTNNELELFLYATSHDMREPLRSVASFGQLLMQRYHSKFEGDSRQFLEYMVQGASRMHSMIEGLLSYARFGNNGVKEIVPLEKVMQEVLDNLKTHIMETSAQITIDSIPEINVDRVPTVRVFQNLLENALKFSGETVPTAHISLTHKKNYWLVGVKDNGIGIDPAYADQIFGVFKRLHASSEYPGTGMGLAICKKIIEKAEGRIWVESTPGNGATFFFTLRPMS